MSFLTQLTGKDDSSNSQEVDNFESDINYNLEDVIDSSDEISLSIDAYEDADNIYIRAFIPAVDPKEIDINISRDTVVISGERFDVTEKNSEDFFQKELLWGKFQKEIRLPKEIDIESIKASVNLGILTLKLEKIDKDRMVKVNVK
jgi:HSP20 family protein